MNIVSFRIFINLTFRFWVPSPSPAARALTGGIFANMRMNAVMYGCNRLQNSPYFCVFKYARAVKQKVWNGPREARALRARKILTPRFTDFFT